MINFIFMYKFYDNQYALTLSFGIVSRDMGQMVRNHKRVIKALGCITL